MKDQDDFDDFDGGLTADNGREEMDPGEGSALKEAWNNNPLLKVGAVVLGLAVLYGGYTAFFKSEEEVVNKSTVVPGNLAEAKAVPGQEVTDELYKDAILQNNEQIRQEAEKTGDSAIPTPVAVAKVGGIDLPEAQNQGSEDPLAEWRARKEKTVKEEVVNTLPQMPELPQMAQPDIVPMTQPVRPQQNANNKLDAGAVKALAQQMRTILGAQVPAAGQQSIITNKESEYEAKRQADITRAADAARMASVGGTSLDAATGLTAAGTPVNSKDPAAKKKVIVPAGNIAYAQLMNELNSDLEGPALAQIMSGPFTGGRAIGAFELKDEYLVISFTRIIKDGVVYNVDGIALNENTTLAAHQSEVNSHYFTRIILPAAAKFVEGYAGAVAETGTETQITQGGGAVQSNDAPSPKESLYKGLEEAGSKTADILDKNSDRPITVTVSKGSTMGILFMESVTTGSVQE